ncbi:E3 ubiquitin-protein ligase MYCBP2, partial [Mytilus galloprovincialis]
MSAKVLPSSRSELDIYLKGNELRTKFHDLFDAYHISQADNKKKQEKKKAKKRSKSKSKEKKSKRDKSPETSESAPPTLEICGNPSMFTVYSTVRQSILEQCMKEATQIYHQSQSLPSDSETDEEREEKSREGPIKLPKIVGLGLTGVFELVKDTRQKYPELCVRALTALLDMLQGQQPESMKSEPADVIENFFSLLMEISTEPGPDKDLSALACSSLLSLVVALGDTGKLLTAVMAMLMANGSLSSQEIMVPGILTGLQKSVQAVLLGKSILPDWLHQGIKVGAEINRFIVEDLPEIAADSTQNCAIASDGEYLYLLNKEGIFKVGSGYKGTIKSHVYQYSKDFPNSANSWLTCAGDQLFCRTDDNTHPCLAVVDSKTFELKDSFHLDGKGHGPCALFSDGDYIGQIASAKDDSFVVRLYNPSVSPMSVVSELPLKLTRKCMDVFGSAQYDPETEKRSINTGFDEDSVFIVSGKEFALVRTSGNKVLYTGRSQALGIKQGGPSQGKWGELPITKSPKIVQISTGHEGQHALLVSEDGSLFFVGTPKRGEDGDASSSKARRQPKAVKPKKIIRMESMSKHVVYTACNNGSSGILTKEGEVYIFGKDTTHCDHATGQVTDLKDTVATQIALGKAHAVVLTDRGQVYTFGINNKGQCGRDFLPGGAVKEANNVTMAEEEEETEVEDGICPDGKHKWKRDQCMVCTVCGECTGYSLNCCNSGDKERQSAMLCGCGAGESGCSECGICRTCAGEQVLEMEDHGKQLELLARHKDYLPFDVEQLLGGNEKLNHVPDLPDSPLAQFFKRLLSKKEPKKKDAAKNQPKAAEPQGNDPEGDYNKVVSLPPQEICIGTGEITVTQISCGQHHTVALLQNGEVYVFGNNNHGQLGQGDTTIRGAPVKVELPMGATQVAAGAQHTVALLSNGQVYTFGNHKSGALGRIGHDEAGGVKNKKTSWYALPGPIPGIGARYGRRATWIGASGDQTFMRIDESLINAHILAASKVFANQTSIGLIPTGEENRAVMKCLMINKVDGSCRSFGGIDQIDLSKQAVCLDPVYDVLWSYSPENREVSCFNSLVTEARPLTSQGHQQCGLFKPELAVPVKMGHKATRSHCALHVLGCLDTLNLAQQLNLTVKEEAKEKQSTAKVYSKEDYAVVNRFASHGGGWGYSGHSMEAVRFMCDTDVLLGGFGLFGGRGEYYGRIKLFELGPDGGDNETDGEMLGESDEVVYECGAREKYAMMFDEPIQIQAQCWYVAWARISGPSSDCGSNGQPVISTDDQVVFKFKSSKKSNNGTDVNAGQIPQLLYRLPSRENSGVVRKVDYVEPAHILGQDFSCSVTPECFEALLSLIQWSWTTFNSSIVEADGIKGDNYNAALSDIKQLVYVNKACLRLIRTYVGQIYPDG